MVLRIQGAEKNELEALLKKVWIWLESNPGPVKLKKSKELLQAVLTTLVVNGKWLVYCSSLYKVDLLKRFQLLA